MRPIVTDRIARSVGLSVTIVSPAKMAERIEMLLGLRTQVGPTYPGGRDNFEGRAANNCKVPMGTLCGHLFKNG